MLRTEGKDIDVRVFPNTNHGMWEFEATTEGKRHYTKVTKRYYEMMADWAKGNLGTSYGASVIN